MESKTRYGSETKFNCQDFDKIYFNSKIYMSITIVFSIYPENFVVKGNVLMQNKLLEKSSNFYIVGHHIALISHTYVIHIL